MRLIDSINRSGRNLRHAKLRTLLTMLAISIGSFALMLTLAAGEGARQFVDRLVGSNFNPQSMYVFKANPQAAEENPFDQDDEPKEYDPSAAETGSNMNGQALLRRADIDKMAAVPQLQKVSPLMELSVDYVTAPEAKKFQSRVKSIEEGIKYEALAGVIPATLQEGSAILPENLVASLGFSSATQAIGQKVIVRYSQGATGAEATEASYTIVAVAKKPNGLLGGANEVILPQKTMEDAYVRQRGNDNPAYLAAIVVAKDDSQATLHAAQTQLKAKGYESMSAKDLATQITQAVSIVQYFVAGFGAIALVVSIFGIVNTQLISVLERTRQIGLMKALGMSGRGVLRLFTFEAIWIGFGGAIIGVGLAYLASIFANPFLDKKLSLGGDLLIFVPLHIAALVGGLMLIAALAGLLPAWKAARLNPIEALRTE